VTIDVLIALARLVENRNFVIEPELHQLMGEAKERCEDTQVRWMRFRPSLEEIKRPPVKTVLNPAYVT
jgi:hypothetical protein